MQPLIQAASSFTVSALSAMQQSRGVKRIEAGDKGKTEQQRQLPVS